MSRFTKDDQALMLEVGKALGYKAFKEKQPKDKKKPRSYTVYTPFGTLKGIEAGSRRDAIGKHLPEFLEGHEGALIRWLGKKAVAEDFKLSIKLDYDKDDSPYWRVRIVDRHGTRTTFTGRPHLAFISRPLCEAVVFVQKEIIGR